MIRIGGLGIGKLAAPVSADDRDRSPGRTGFPVKAADCPVFVWQCPPVFVWQCPPVFVWRSTPVFVWAACNSRSSIPRFSLVAFRFPDLKIPGVFSRRS